MALVMLHALLTDRFKLVTHVEDRPATVYALTVPKGGPKLKKADATERANCKPDPNAPPIGVTAAPTIAYRCQNTTMVELAAKCRSGPAPTSITRLSIRPAFKATPDRCQWIESAMTRDAKRQTFWDTVASARA